MEATRFRLDLAVKLHKTVQEAINFKFWNKTCYILFRHFIKSGVLWAKLPLCVNKFTQLVPLVLSVLPTMSIRNHIIGGSGGRGAVVNTLDSGSRRRGFEPHSGRRVVSFSKTYLAPPPPPPKVLVIPRQRWLRPNIAPYPQSMFEQK